MTTQVAPSSSETLIAATLRVRGTVQGVGFRPTVWQVARKAGLCGFVRNDADGVLIFLQGFAENVQGFEPDLRAALPPLARLDSVTVQTARPDASLNDFRIVESHAGLADTAVCPDAAVCPACLSEIRDPANRRYRYAFTNCTHCGPRFSILRHIPYDRANTSMNAFRQCPDCEVEYRDPADRRFHAQPNACPTCGPSLWFERSGGERVEGDPIDLALQVIRTGGIVAIKGIGGFHLACDASNPNAIEALRQRKHRPAKPLAMMARDIDMVRRYAEVTDLETDALCSTAAPVVVVSKPSDCELPESLAPDVAMLGFMLPYSPLHALLMDALDVPLVMTSGNPSGRPQCIDNTEALDSLSSIADAFLMHDRDIENRVDDSVLRLIDGEMRFLRRARGYAPAPVKLPGNFSTDSKLIALGAELKNTFALSFGKDVLVSQHIGDLEDAANLDDLQKNLQLWGGLFGTEALQVAIDHHPEYLSSKLGQEMSGEAALQVQHHHAHFAACLGDNNIPDFEEHYLGIILDGLGLGDDDTLWGAEILLGNYRGYRRVGGLEATPLPGASQAIRQPWRNLYARLSGTEYFAAFASAFPEHTLIQQLNNKPLKTIDSMLKRELNCPPCSSAGRLFDAVAAALGLAFDEQSFEGEAAMQLESLAAASDDDGSYPITLKPGERLMLDETSLWPHLLLDLGDEVPACDIARRFHQGLASALVEATVSLAERHRVRRVALSGGVFQNRILSETISQGLQESGLDVLQHRQVPANDGGIAFGQVLVTLAANASH